MLKNITITVDEEALRWARRQAAEKEVSVSKFVGQLLDQQMRRSDEYWKAFERWKSLPVIPGLDASKRLSRDEAHARGR